MVKMIEIISYSIDLCLPVIINRMFFCRHMVKKKIWYYLFAILIGMILVSAKGNKLDNEYSAYILLAQTAVVVLLFKEKWYIRIRNVFLSMGVNLLLLVLTLYLLRSIIEESPVELLSYSNPFFLLMLCVILIMIVAIKILLIKYLKGQNKYRNNIGLIKLFVAFCMMIIWSVMWIYLDALTKNAIKLNTMSYYLIRYGVLIIGIVFFFGMVMYFISDSKKKYYKFLNSVKEKSLTTQERYYNKLLIDDMKLKGLHHDMRSHIRTLKLLAIESDRESLLKYLSDLDQTVLTLTEKQFNSGNHIINGILSEFSTISLEHNTEIKLEGYIRYPLNIAIFDLSSLFYNLLSNAEEACKEYFGNKKREIEVLLGVYKENLYIIIKNPVNQNVELKMLGNGTTKMDKTCHGFGIRNIKNVVDKYNGEIAFTNNKGEFCVEIVFNSAFNIIK